MYVFSTSLCASQKPDPCTNGGIQAEREKKHSVCVSTYIGWLFRNSNWIKCVRNERNIYFSRAHNVRSSMYHFIVAGKWNWMEEKRAVERDRRASGSSLQCPPRFQTYAFRTTRQVDFLPAEGLLTLFMLPALRCFIFLPLISIFRFPYAHTNINFHSPWRQFEFCVCLTKSVEHPKNKNKRRRNSEKSETMSTMKVTSKA